MKIRIISDLHLDLNKDYPFGLEGDEFAVVAGDTSGYNDITAKWLRKNLKGGGVFVSGNHLVYNYSEKNIQELRDELAREFPPNGEITYLDVESGCFKKEAGGILFLGTCLYTDFALPVRSCAAEDENMVRIRNMSISLRNLNDYKWGTSPDGNGLSPADYLDWFDNGIKAFMKALSENNAKENPLPVVVVTHHAPLPACISDQYRDSTLNASYASDLEWLIKNYPSIKCWIYGHVHGDPKTIEVKRSDGSSCLVVNNARGYCRSLEDVNFNPDTFLDTETWTIEKTPLGKDARDELERRTSEFLKNTAPFII